MVYIIIKIFFRSDDTDCYAKIEKEYKFYLSFENSLCTDYVTEKFFNVLKYNMVPVTYNGAEMEKFAPRHSYINALDFPSVQELAKYLEKVTLFSFSCTKVKGCLYVCMSA